MDEDAEYLKKIVVTNYDDIRESLGLILEQEIVWEDVIEKILQSLDDAVGNNLEHLDYYVLVKCEECGTDIRDTQRFCPYCGTEQEEYGKRG